MFGPSSTATVNLNIRRGLRNVIRNVSDRIDKGESFTAYEPIVDMVCRAYTPGWLQMAEWRIERGSDSDLDSAILNVQAFLQGDQNRPGSADAWSLLANIYYMQGNLLGEVHAFVERAQFEEVPFYDLSNTANLLNHKYHELDFDDGKLQLTQRLLDVMEERRQEARPDDYSKMAWLALHLSQRDKAEEFAELGLDIDPENVHCQRIATRLGLGTET